MTATASVAQSNFHGSSLGAYPKPIRTSDLMRTWENRTSSPTSTCSTGSMNQYYDKNSTVGASYGPTAFSRHVRPPVSPTFLGPNGSRHLPGHDHPQIPVNRHAPALQYAPVTYEQPYAANITPPGAYHPPPGYVVESHAPTGRQNRTLFFSNFSFTLDERTFRDRLNRCAPGQVVDVKLNISRTKNRDSAVATFATAVAADQVQRGLNGRVVDGRQLQVRWDREGGESSHGSSSSNSSREREKRRRKEKQLKANTCRRELRNREEQQQQAAAASSGAKNGGQLALTRSSTRSTTATEKDRHGSTTTAASGHSKSASSTSSTASDGHKAKGPTIVKGGLMERPGRQRHRRGDSDAGDDDENASVREDDMVFRGRAGHGYGGKCFSSCQFLRRTSLPISQLCTPSTPRVVP